MRGFVKYLMWLLVSMLSVSCTSDSDPSVAPADEPRNIIFTISFADNKSRATWEEDYTKEDGVPFDLRINPEKLHVVVFAENDTRLGTLEYLLYFPTDNDGTKYQFIGQMPAAFTRHYKANPDEKYKFMVLANCDTNPDGEESATYSYTQLNPTEEGASIPMWGVTEFVLTPLVGNQRWDIGEISLLRAAAKVEVKLSDDLINKGTTITSATLKYYNQTGYVLPEGGMTAEKTADLDQEKCVRVYRHAAVNLPFIKDETTGNYYVYVTEYDNINYSGERNKISLTCKVGDKEKTFEDAISFCRYDNESGLPVEDSHYNIVRNHIYEYTITKIAGSNLVLEYTVANWTTEDWGNGKGYEEHDVTYPTYHNPVVPRDFLILNATAQKNYEITQEPTMHYNAIDQEEGGFHCYFQILAPVNVEWQPVFMGTKENYKIRVYKLYNNLMDESEVLYETGGNENNLGACGAGEWFHIVVFPLSDDGKDVTEVEFGITYDQKWTDQYINLYVNGEYDNIRWPNSGNNPKYIKIRHVSQQVATN